MDSLIHKRMTDNSRCGDRTWRLCDSSISFTKLNGYSYHNPDFIKWAETNKYHWQYVTCPECLKMKPKDNKMTDQHKYPAPDKDSYISQLEQTVQTLRNHIKEQDRKIFNYNKRDHLFKEALEKIEDPRKMDHKERDNQTQIYCLQNVAHVALLEAMKPEYKV